MIDPVSTLMLGRWILGKRVERTWVPLDRRLIDPDLLSAPERAWVDTYHAGVLAKIGPKVDGAVLAWLTAACAPL